MRVLIQRVRRAAVLVDGSEISSIQKGLLLLVAVGKNDEEDDIANLSRKVVNLRIFDDEKGRMNFSIKQVDGKMLSVSQFTLYADTRKGNRPGFDQSSEPGKAKKNWEKFNDMLRGHGVEVEEGIFGARMEVGLVNDGPVTIWLDSEDKN
jgi:D-tyrosyl-tRNA(Tyr) deacylase